jgi:phosphopantothenoylcysteine decarboxylase
MPYYNPTPMRGYVFKACIGIAASVLFASKDPTIQAIDHAKLSWYGSLVMANRIAGPGILTFCIAMMWDAFCIASVKATRREMYRSGVDRPLYFCDRNKNFRAEDHVNDRKHHVLLAATGSVATIKLPEIVRALSKHDNISIRLLLTESARKFLQDQSAEQPDLLKLSQLSVVDGVYFDEDEWRKPWVRGDNILHIELRRWADLMVIAPLSANSLAKISQGMADNLTTSVVRAWDFSGLIDGVRPGVPLPYAMQRTEGGVADDTQPSGKKGIIVAPAMNTAMWQHPVTAKQIAVLEDEWGVKNDGRFEVLRPIEKTLACGDTGSGAMRDWKEIVSVVEERLGLGTSAEHKKWVTV